jgi:hypothetical protein
VPPRRNDMEENAKVSARVKLLRPGAMPSYGEKGEQRTALHRAVWELFGRAVLISTTWDRLVVPPVVTATVVAAAAVNPPM